MAKIQSGSIIIIFLIIFSSLEDGFALDSLNVNLPEEENFHLFILAGQSNMAGRGEIKPQDQNAPERVFKFNQNGLWMPAVDPIHYDKPIAGVGPGKSFGNAVADYDTTITVGLIPCAVGGSSITAWEPGGIHEQTKAHPYDDCISRTQLAMKHGVLKAILWLQGTSDGNQEQAPLYKERLYKLVNRFRDDLNAPDLFFTAGQLTHFEEWPLDQWRKMVNDATASLLDSIPNTDFISTVGLSHIGDLRHFDSSSAQELGKRYAEAYIKYVRSRGIDNLAEN